MSETGRKVRKRKINPDETKLPNDNEEASGYEYLTKTISKNSSGRPRPKKARKTVDLSHDTSLASISVTCQSSQNHSLPKNNEKCETKGEKARNKLSSKKSAAKVGAIASQSNDSEFISLTKKKGSQKMAQKKSCIKNTPDVCTGEAGRERDDVKTINKPPRDKRINEKDHNTSHEKIKRPNVRTKQSNRSSKKEEDGGGDDAIIRGKRPIKRIVNKKNNDDNKKCEDARMNAKKTRDETLSEKLASTSKYFNDNIKENKIKPCRASRGNKSGKVEVKSRHFASACDELVNVNNVSEVLMHMEGPSWSGVRDGVGDGREHMDQSDNSDESDWEAVEDHVEDESMTRHQIPTAIEVVMEAPKPVKVKRKFDWKAYFRQLHGRYLRRIRLQSHKVQLMCLLSHARFCSAVCNFPFIQAVALSLTPLRFSTSSPSSTGVHYLSDLASWFRQQMTLWESSVYDNDGFNLAILSEAILKQSTASKKVFVAMFVVVLRSLGYDTRLLMSFQPITIKIDTADTVPDAFKSTRSEKMKKASAAKKPKTANTDQKSDRTCDTTGNGGKKREGTKQNIKTQEVKQTRGKGSVRKSVRAVGSKTYYDEDQCSDDSSRGGGGRKSQKNSKDEDSDRKSQKNSKDEDSDESYDNNESDEDVSEYFTKFRSPKSSSIAKKKPKVTKDSSKPSITETDFWVEVYLEKENQWICVDVLNQSVKRPDRIECVCTQPLHYVLAVDNDGAVKDLTCRYASKWLTHTWRLRVDKDWWRETLNVYKSSNTHRNDEEDLLLTVQQTDKPLPTSIAEYKNHPLYVLKRHLLKFESLYPPTVIPLGYIKNEPIYSRDCVKTLHTREVWIREGRCVKPHEEPYKMVKSLSRANKNRRGETLDAPLFGHWQTELYKPPAAANGIVPKNEYGNVELFKPSMLPEGTVHLPYNGLLRVAKKLDIDTAPALVGFELHSGFNTPKFEGVVVCVEHKDALMAAYEEDLLIQRQRAKDKIEQRVVANWTKLVRGLRIRERLRLKYNVQPTQDDSVPGLSSQTSDVADPAITPGLASGITPSIPLDYGLLTLLKEAQELGRISAFWSMDGDVYVVKERNGPRIHIRDTEDFLDLMK